MNQTLITLIAAAATISAALISATIAFLTLIISKEQKTSEFRQQWIDSLRNELSDFLSAANVIAIEAQVLVEKNNEGFEVTAKDISECLSKPVGEAYSKYHRVSLRLNPKEHVKLLSLVEQLENSFSNPTALMDGNSMDRMGSELNVEARTVLKKEWSRVKRGELTYRFAKYFSALLSIALFLGALSYVCSRLN